MSTPGGPRTATRTAPSASIVSSSSARPFVAACRRAASSEPISSAWGWWRSTSVDAAGHDALVDEARRAPAQVEHRRLGQAADDLVRARDHEVRPGRERVLGQRLVEGEVRAPRLVHHERHAVRVGHLDERGHVGHGAVVGGRDDDRGHRVRLAPQRAVERLRRRCSARAKLRVELRRDEGRPHAGDDQRVDRARVRVPLHHHRRARRGRASCSRHGCPARPRSMRNQERRAPPGLRRQPSAPPAAASAARPRRCRG